MGQYLHFALVTANGARMYTGFSGSMMERPELRTEDTLAREGRAQFLRDVDLLQSYIIKWKRADLLEKLWALDLLRSPSINLEKSGIANRLFIRDDLAGGGWRERVGLPFQGRFQSFQGGPAQAQDSRKCSATAGVRIVDFGSYAAGLTPR